ncbi:MAG: TIGR02266 family protein [Myxococcales bacterium]|nr:TIGR02266 family protein [Myxococcales bacterium]
MTDQDVELSRREAEQAQEEANLHAELTRIMAATLDYERRVKHLKNAVAEAELNGASDGHLSERARTLSVPTLDAEGAFSPAREQRVQALASRHQAIAEVRQRITAFRAQIAQLGQTLTTDEKLVQRVVTQAKQAAAAQAQAALATEEALGATMISAAPVPGLRQRAATQPPVAAPTKASSAAAVAAAAKRQSPRVRMQAQVDFESDDNFFNGFSANISDGGVFVATVNVLPLGTSVDIGFTLPTGERIECKGVVRWVREIDDKQPDVFPGMGVQFVDLEDRSAQAIESFIQQREPMFYVE